MPAFALLSTAKKIAATLFIACALPLALLVPGHAADEAALWQAIRSGEAFAILRHELAPGTGDPGNFTIGDCTTQRNLDDTGRQRAIATGKRFRDNAIERADVYSSQWCRCRDTATLLGVGEVKDLPALNSFYENYEVSAAQTNELKQWLGARNPAAPLILVSHQVNIRALTGRSTRSGEIIVGRIGADGKITVLGSL